MPRTTCLHSTSGNYAIVEVIISILGIYTCHSPLYTCSTSALWLQLPENVSFETPGANRIQWTNLHNCDLCSMHVLSTQACAGWFDLKRTWNAYARGKWLLSSFRPSLSRCMLQKWLTQPYENQGIAYATRSYDTTLLEMYSGGFWRCSTAPPTRWRE